MSTFVVRFLGDLSEDLRGRVRHVSSGEEISFSSIAEPLRFFEGMSVVGIEIATGRTTKEVEE